MRCRRSLGTVLAAVTGLTLAPAVADAAPAPGRFHQQQANWRQCPPDPETPWIPWEKLECADIMVPLDHRKPDEGTLKILITRLKAKDPARRQGVLLLNPGGPGGPGADMPVNFENNKIAQHFDLIGFDPRGTGRSTALECEIGPFDTYTSRPADADLPKIAAEAQAREAACQRAAGGIRPHISTANTARDMDVIRGVLGEKKINYLGFSYGTYLGAVYGSLFPGRLNRSVLDSSMHPEWFYYEASKRQSIAATENVHRWAEWLAARDRTFGFGKTPAAVLATFDELGRKLAATPVDLLDPPPNVPQMRNVDRTRLDAILAVSRFRPLWTEVAQVVGKLRALAGGKLDQDTSKALGLLAGLAIPETMPGVFQTVTCEFDWPQDLNTYYDQMKLFREKYPYGRGAMAAAPTECTFRGFTPPEKPVDLKRAGYPAGLVIQAENDANTHYDGGPAMANRLRHNLISIPDEGGHGFYGRNTCVTAKVDEYLINGVLPGSRSLCAGSPRPDVPADTEPASPQLQGGSLAGGIQAIIKRHQLDRRV